MENNKVYLRRFPVIFLVSLFTSIALQLIVDRTSLSDRGSWWMMVLQYLPIVLFFVNLGVATGKWKAIAGSAAAFLVVSLVLRFTYDDFEKLVGRNWVFIVVELLYLFSLFSFFLFAGISRQRLLPVFGGVLLVAGLNAPYNATDGFEWLGNLFSVHLNIPSVVISSVSMVVIQLVQVLLFCELYNLGLGKNQGAQQRIINPGNKYEKPAATLLFLVLKVFIMFSIVGMMDITLSWERYSYSGFNSVFSWYRKFQFIIMVLVLLGVAWYLRKFLLEYFFSYGYTSKTLYWALLLPIIGIFIWLIAMLDRQKLEKNSDRNQTLSRFAHDTASVIIAIVVFFMVVQALWVLGRGQGRLLIPILLSGGLFALMVSSRGGYLLNLILSFGLILFFVLVKQGRDAGLPLLLPLLVLNVVQIYLLNAAFHFEDFAYLQYEEEETTWEPGKDLF